MRVFPSPLSDKNTTRALYGCYKALVVSLQSPCSVRTRPLYESERNEGGRERLLPYTECKSKNFFLYVLFIFCPFVVNVFLFLSVCVFFSIFAEICIGGCNFLQTLPLPRTARGRRKSIHGKRRNRHGYTCGTVHR